MSVGREALKATAYREMASLIVIADTDEGLARLAGHAARAQCRVSGKVRLEEGLRRLDRQAAADAVLLELEREQGELADRVLSRIVAGVDAGRYGAVVCVSPALLDAAAVSLLHPGIGSLSAPTALDWVIAITVAAGRPPPRFHDIGKGQGTARLRQLSEEVGRIAGILAALSENEDVAAATGAADIDRDDGTELDAGFVRAIIRARRLREQFFSGELFADPAWDMLLDLTAARLDHQRVAVSSLCIAAAVPPTTALRWIKSLCERGLFVRTADPQDGRRVFIELSDVAAATMSAYLKAARRVSPAAL